MAARLEKADFRLLGSSGFFFSDGSCAMSSGAGFPAPPWPRGAALCETELPDGLPPALPAPPAVPFKAAPAGMPPPAAILRLSEDTVFASSVAEM
jgi:hypothetical protein